MRKKRELFFLQIKLAFQSIPVILSGTVILTLLIALMAFAGIKMMSADEENTAMNVALVVEDDSKYTRMAISYIMEEESVKKMCTFTEMSLDEAEQALLDGTAFAAVVIPKDFLAGILNGVNIPARIILPEKGMNSQSKIFRELINAGTTDLATAQAAIYAVDDLCYVTGIDAVSEAEDYLNKKLMLYALRRNTYYGKIQFSDTGDLSVAEFYIAAGIVLLLLLSGITCCDILKRENGAFLFSLIRQEIHPCFLTISRLAGVFAVYSVILCSLYCLMVFLGKISFSAMALVSIPVLVFSVFAINLFIFQVADSKMAGAMILFLGTVVMMFVSGCFIPEVFLPENVNFLGNFLPAKWLTTLCGQILTGEVLLRTFEICFLYGTGFVLLTVLYQHLLEQRGKI